ncbi:MAG: hypothetical protein Dbin4_02861 [Alphaproteobacteria bacterium]|nr:hypothetical protein [Alphaproteobacteria bacterium]
MFALTAKTFIVAFNPVINTRYVAGVFPLIETAVIPGAAHLWTTWHGARGGRTVNGTQYSQMTGGVKTETKG